MAAKLFSGQAMTINEAVTDGGAIAAVASPLWLPGLHEISTFAALILPILGVIWLAMQIYYRLRHKKKLDD